MFYENTSGGLIGFCVCVGRLVRAPEFEPSFEFFLNEERFGLAILTSAAFCTSG